MPRDYAKIARALRAKADDPVTPAPEAQALRERAAELDVKYGNSSSPPTDNTIPTTGYDEFVFRMYTKPRQPPPPPSPTAWEQVYDLFENQWKWNDRYYDRHGNPRKTEADIDDMYAEEYKYEPGEDEDV